MAYTQFADNKPVDTDNGPTVVDNTRDNLMALRDMVVTGAMPGWDFSEDHTNSGDSSQPDYLLWSKNDSSTEAIKAVLTWGTSGGADGNVTTAVYHYSTDDFSSSDETIGTEDITYYDDGSVKTMVWR